MKRDTRAEMIGSLLLLAFLAALVVAIVLGVGAVTELLDGLELETT